MIRFYWPLLRQVLTTLVGTPGRVRSIGVLIVVLLAAFNQKIASLILKTWGGFSPLYAVGLLAVFLLWELARANYEAFRTLGGVPESRTQRHRLYNFFHADMEPAYKAAFDLLSRIANRLCLPDQDRELETTIRVGVLDPADSAFSDLDSAVRQGAQPILPRLWEGYQAYERMRKTLDAVLPTTQAWVGLDAPVTQWREADRQFREALDNLLTDHDYAALREALEGTLRIRVSAAWPTRQPTVLIPPAEEMIQRGTPVQTLEPLLMRDTDYRRDVKAPLEADNWEIAEPDPAGVQRCERRGYERIYKEHLGQSRPVVIGTNEQSPDNVPMRRRRITEDTTRLLRTAYTNAQSGSDYCVRSTMDPGVPSIALDDGSTLTGDQARDALQEAQDYDLLVQNPRQHNVFCLTDLGKARARDILERGMAQPRKGHNDKPTSLALPPSQQADVARIIQEAGLPPSDFTWAVQPSRYALIGPLVSALVHAPTGCYFRFEFTESAIGQNRVSVFISGEGAREVTKAAASWEDQLGQVRAWLTHLTGAKK